MNDATVQQQQQQAFFAALRHASLRSNASCAPYDRSQLLRLFYDAAATDDARRQFVAALWQRGSIDAERTQGLVRVLASEHATHTSDALEADLEICEVPDKADIGRDRSSDDAADHAAAAAAAADAVDAMADRLVDQLFLPLKAIAQCRSIVSVDADANDSTDSADDDNEALQTAPYKGPTVVSSGTALRVFPPSPMTTVDEDGDQTESGAVAASWLSLLDPEALRLLQSLHRPRPAFSLDKAACESENMGDGECVDVIALDPAWAGAFVRFHAVLAEPSDAPGNKPPLAVAVRPDLPDLPDLPIIPVDTVSRDANGQASSRLLALHARVARILHGSGADAYIDGILADTSIEDLDAGGSTHLGRLMELRIDGWWDGGRSHCKQRQRQRPDQIDGATGTRFWIETAIFRDEE